MFRRLHRLARPAPVEPPAGRRARAPRRRVLAGWAAAVGLLSRRPAVLTGWLIGGRTQSSRAGRGRRSWPASRWPSRLRRSRPGPTSPSWARPPFLTPNPDFYRIDTALRVPAVVRRRLDAAGARPGRARADPALRRPAGPPAGRADDHDDLRVQPGRRRPHLHRHLPRASSCATSWLEAGIRAGADQLLSTSSDGWTAGTPIDVLLEPDRGALLAVGMNDEPLPPEHGFPVRMVVPGLYGYVSATKWLTDLEVTTFEAAQAYWMQRGWAARAPIKTQSRIDRPRRVRRRCRPVG